MRASGTNETLASERDPEAFVELFGAVKKQFAAHAAQLYAEAGVGPLQAKLLRHIGKNSRISQAELARATSSDPALIGRTLQTLMERDLVRRERSDEDRREYVLELSPAGKKLRARIERLRAQLVARFTRTLDARDFDDFARIAEKLIAALAS